MTYRVKLTVTIVYIAIFAAFAMTGGLRAHGAELPAAPAVISAKVN